MRNLKRLCAFFLTLTTSFAIAATAFAAVEDTGFSDVAADAWYAQAVEYVRDHGLMAGTSDTTFSPNTPMTRAMLATVLYRQAGSPAVTGAPDFTDTVEGSWYADAVLWASSNGFIYGYGNGLFGTDDPVTREQIAAILWRYEDSPTADAGTDFADESAISSWAAAAVDWARSEGIINGKSGNQFDPAGEAIRAEVATILMNYTQGGQSAPEPSPEPAPEPTPTPNPMPETGNRVLVAYFSNTGNTETVAEHLMDILDADPYEIEAAEPYTTADLNYSNSDCRANQEQNDPNARPTISGGVDNMDEYGVVFLGYPIWWGQAPKIISTFLESYDFDGKTIVPFCTSGSSGIGSSATNLHDLAPDANWLSGQRFGSNASRSSVESWVDGLDLPDQADHNTTASALRVSVSDGANTVTYELNNSQAARDLYDQLPLSVAVEDYSTNEKIFYPPEELNTAGAPQAAGGAGTLAYYAPWGDVVLFYDSFSANSQLYGLGTAISGAASIGDLSGTVTVVAAE